MSVPTSNASPPRLLKPVAGKIQNDGAAFVPLSPHKGIRNAAIIYESIRSMPASTLVRGDFDKQSRPLIYFPDRPPKRIGKVGVDTVAARNASHDRAEFASFIRSIVEATFKAAPAQSPELHAALNLRNKTLSHMQADRDFTVGDIRGSLRSIAKAYNRQTLKNITSPHRTQPGAASPLQAKRFRQFGDIKGEMIVRLCDALSLGLDDDDAQATALMAVQDMKQLLFRYRVLRDAENLSFADFLHQHAIPRGVQTFARLWLALSGPDRAGRTQFCTESWALEMDRVCPLIVKEYRAAKRMKHRGGSSEDWGKSEKSSAGSESDSSASPQPRVRRVAKRPKAPATVISGGEASANLSSWTSPRLTRQSSMPQLRGRSRPELDESDKSSDPQVSFLDARPTVETVIYYSAIDTSASASVSERETPATASGQQGLPGMVMANDEEKSRIADDSGNADIFSQEER